MTKQTYKDRIEELEMAVVKLILDNQLLKNEVNTLEKKNLYLKVEVEEIGKDVITLQEAKR